MASASAGVGLWVDHPDACCRASATGVIPMTRPAWPACPPRPSQTVRLGRGDDPDVQRKSKVRHPVGIDRSVRAPIVGTVVARPGIPSTSTGMMLGSGWAMLCAGVGGWTVDRCCGVGGWPVDRCWVLGGWPVDRCCELPDCPGGQYNSSALLAATSCLWGFGPSRYVGRDRWPVPGRASGGGSTIRMRAVVLRRLG